MKQILGVTALALCLAAPALAAPKVGMITTLSGGGAHLGVDVRDGFLLALELAGSDMEVIVRDDAVVIGGRVGSS